MGSQIRFDPAYEYSGLLEREGVVVRIVRAEKLWLVMDGCRLVGQASDRTELESRFGVLSGIVELEPQPQVKEEPPKEAEPVQQPAVQEQSA